MTDLQTGWQAGPASLAVEADEVTFDDGTVGIGFLFDIETTIAQQESILELGPSVIDVGSLTGKLRVSLCANREQLEAVYAEIGSLLEADDLAPK